MKSCYIRDLYLRRDTVFFFIIFLMFSIKKINTGNFKKKNIRSEEPTYFLFCSESRQKSPMFFFQLKDLENIRPEEPATFFFFFFYESREKRSGLNMETKTTIRPDPPLTPCLPLCCIYFLTKPGNTILYCQKNLKYYK